MSPRLAVAFTSLMLTFAAPAFAEGAHTHWTYEGAEGPAAWGKLSPDFAACEAGQAQSPIDIVGAVPAQLGPIGISYPKQAASIINNGHTIQANIQPGASIDLEGQRYDLVQFHFHHPSEHEVADKKAPMELHLVHKNAQTGQLAVLGVMIVPGPENTTLAPVWAAMPAKEGKADKELTLDLAKLVPANRDYFRYEGSLTTPPCSEVVHWVVLKQPITLSQAQIDAFAALFPDNARPIQPQNRRFVLQTAEKK
ncbi:MULTISPECIES: carbonic anhydrase [unclassified Azospirillum]|uniref:carbonic anhydrase n=1 Tax=unclassified Azospirillum TaxID=2630922 RepID=UPI000B78165A|nr:MULTISPECIES: carbonic anhydrase [unclassified Azospirillum]